MALEVNLCTTMSNYLNLTETLEASLAKLAAKLDALDAKFEAMAAKIEALGPQQEAPVSEQAPQAPDLGRFGHLSVLEQHRMQQRGSDY